MSTLGLNPTIHAPNRLQICALLAPLEMAEFQVLRDALQVTDSVLSKHIKKLEEAGYVKLRKQKMNGRQHTWALLTGKGHKAFKAHVAALEHIVAMASIPQ
jgi:DNA-binding MarR family transcriptional regulator